MALGAGAAPAAASAAGAGLGAPVTGRARSGAARYQGLEAAPARAPVPGGGPATGVRFAGSLVGDLVRPGTVRVPIEALATDNRGAGVKAFVAGRDGEVLHVVLVTDDWTALEGASPRAAARTVRAGLDQALRDAFDGKPPLRADAVPDGARMLTVRLGAADGVDPATLRVGSILDNLGFVLFAKPGLFREEPSGPLAWMGSARLHGAPGSEAAAGRGGRAGAGPEDLGAGLSGAAAVAAGVAGRPGAGRGGGTGAVGTAGEIGEGGGGGGRAGGVGAWWPAALAGLQSQGLPEGRGPGALAGLVVLVTALVTGALVWGGAGAVAGAMATLGVLAGGLVFLGGVRVLTAGLRRDGG